ncbi:MAG TPA: zinc ribbon domain-containing protein [Pyrinomonadaceae bacterium]|nr:zinc ribbon domain-containing protein [Pyrinomonadaceae bacterium]
MYCSTCGAAVARGLRFCKHCGEELPNTRRGGARAEAAPETLVAAMVFLFAVGLAAVIALLQVMKGVEPSDAALIKAFAVFSFMLLLSVEAVFARLLLRRRRAAREADGEAREPLRQKADTTRELDAAPERSLAEATPLPVPSVIENTTRTLEPVIVNRKSD